MTSKPACPCAEHDCPGDGGGYYVSIWDRLSNAGHGRLGLLAGPYETHAEALSKVGRARELAAERDPWACFYGFGTVRMKDSYRKLGAFGKL